MIQGRHTETHRRQQLNKPSSQDEIMREVMSGKATNSQTAAFLTALRMKGEAVEELIAFASVMREQSSQIHPHMCRVASWTPAGQAETK